MKQKHRSSEKLERNSVWIVIPAYNEDSAIQSVIESVRTAGYENVLVVDDGSRDNTAAKAKGAGADVLTHLINRGQGAALKTGIEYIGEAYHPKSIVTFDADGQHQAQDIDSLVRPILRGDIDIVLGSRFIEHQETIPFFRKVILKLGTLFTNFTSHVSLTDTHNGFRALGPKAYQHIRITHRGMEHASDIIDEISRNKLRYCEVPVRVLYSEYSLGKGQKTSHFIKLGIKILLRKLL